jgi:hypothetical protein
LVYASGAARASVPFDGLDNAVIVEVCGLDLPWRTRDDLLGRQGSALNHPTHDVAGHSELQSSLAHGEPVTILLRRAVGVDAANPPYGCDAVCRPGLVLAGPQARFKVAAVSASEKRVAIRSMTARACSGV